MIGNYIRTTYRYLVRHRLFTGINLAGMSIAFCVVYFAWLYVDFERSYDTFNPNRDRILRVSTDVRSAQGVSHETSAAPLADELISRFPEVAAATRVFLDYYIVQKENDPASEVTLAYADSSIFSVMHFPLIAGTPSSVFRTPYSIVVSESAAKKYFGTTDCLGGILTLDGTIPATVTGVMRDIPRNAHFRTDMLLSMSSLIQPGSNWMSNWGRFGFSTYGLLRPGTDPDLFRKKLAAIPGSHPLKDGLPYQLVTEPLATLYLEGSFRGNKAGATTYGKRANIYIFSVVALLVLVIACFNFINLTTALYLNRSREIGVRKVNGASTRSIFFQLLTDAVILAACGFAGALLLCVLLTPVFNSLAGKTVITSVLAAPYRLVFFFVVALIGGILAGIYPALIHSARHPVKMLARKGEKITGGLFLRRILVTAQFTLSVLLIGATIVVYRQLHFLQHEELGFTPSHNLVIDYHYDPRITEHPEAVRAQLAAIPGVGDISYASCIPGRPNKTFATTLEAADGNTMEFQSDAWFVDEVFLDQYGIDVIAGRSFSRDMPGDLRQTMIINEATVRKLGFTSPGDAIGKPFVQRGNTGTIIGVTKDFYYHSAHGEIQPLTIMMAPGFYTFLTISVQSSHPEELISRLRQQWNRLAPGLPMIHFFADETYNAQYLAEERFGKLFGCLAVTAILISCMGLLGLTFFNTIRRRREIGIRKVLGASVRGIAGLLLKEFFILMTLATCIAVPLSFVLMTWWLQEFSHRISSIVWIPVVAGMIAVVTAVMMISFVVVGTARQNPVHALRTE